jgi:hypothetical protein
MPQMRQAATAYAEKPGTIAAPSSGSNGAKQAMVMPARSSAQAADQTPSPPPAWQRNSMNTPRPPAMRAGGSLFAGIALSPRIILFILAVLIALIVLIALVVLLRHMH